MTAPLPAVERPNGKLYRPRSLAAYAFEDDHAGEPGVVVFGTHDPDRARVLALQAARAWYGAEYVIDPERVWWRDGIEHGERRWRHDTARGRAGVCFTASDDADEVTRLLTAIGEAS